MEDDRTFSTDFTDEGLAKLRDLVEHKLKEFMGDYTDDILVEYVIVLLKNGRRKDEARNELDVFLGDDSDSFVTWLWDHLGSHINLYVQPSYQDEIKNTKSEEMGPAGRIEFQQIESVAEKKPSRKRRSSDWKELVTDEHENEERLPESSSAVHVKDHNGRHQKVDSTKRPSSPWETNEKTRRAEERKSVMTDVSPTTAGGPRRLLQFAVRDAVKSPNTPTEPSTRRLRSVLATSTGDLLPVKRPKTNRLAADMSAAIKAMAEAANDANKVRPSRNVFDRLGHTSARVHNNSINNEEEYRGLNEDRLNRSYRDERDGIISRGTSILSSDVEYDGARARYDNVDLRGQRALGTSSEAHDWSHIDVGQPKTTSISSRKIVSSVNMDTLRTSQFEDVRKVSVMDRIKVLQSDAVATKFEVRLKKDSDNPIMEEANGNAKPETIPRQEISQKTWGPTGESTGSPTEDADSRAIYVSNVHFAATKDSLSRHFNPFGEVSKVVILNDPATGQPKGSAYIEFTRKEAAEQALSLNGTSFLSRILKVIRKSSAPYEASATVTSWPRATRASTFPVPRVFSRAQFGRGIPSLYRPRTPIKPGARSFQWNREAAATSSTEVPGQVSINVVPPPMTRSSLTYVRSEPKTESKTIANSGTA